MNILHKHTRRKNYIRHTLPTTNTVLLSFKKIIKQTNNQTKTIKLIILQQQQIIIIKEREGRKEKKDNIFWC